MIATRENLPVVLLRRRLSLARFALGTNTGIRRIVAGEGGELTGGDREDQETSMLALHLLQSALVHLTTPARPTRPRRAHLGQPTTRIDRERTAEAAATP